MNKLQFRWITFLFLVILGCEPPKKEEAPKKPNIIYILADDLGYGDVSVYNPDSKIKTPNIDQLASEGMRLQTHTLPLQFVLLPDMASLQVGTVGGAGCQKVY